MTLFEIIQQYFVYGYSHVIPLGVDHILFILSIFLLNSNIKSVIIQCSVFTLAHTITLGLAAGGYIIPDSKYVEPLIAISILFTSIENIIRDKISNWRLLIIFIFGLIHGMGFANALKEIGFAENHFLLSLLFFNIGVEAGQLSIILAAWFLMAKWFSKKSWYKQRIVYPLSAIIACIALNWTIERIFL